MMSNKHGNYVKQIRRQKKVSGLFLAEENDSCPFLGGVVKLFHPLDAVSSNFLLSAFQVKLPFNFSQLLGVFFNFRTL